MNIWIYSQSITPGWPHAMINVCVTGPCAGNHRWSVVSLHKALKYRALILAWLLVWFSRCRNNLVAGQTRRLIAHVTIMTHVNAVVSFIRAWNHIPWKDNISFFFIQENLHETLPSTVPPVKCSTEGSVNPISRFQFDILHTSECFSELQKQLFDLDWKHGKCHPYFTSWCLPWVRIHFCDAAIVASFCHYYQ